MKLALFSPITHYPILTLLFWKSVGPNVAFGIISIFPLAIKIANYRKEPLHHRFLFSSHYLSSARETFKIQNLLSQYNINKTTLNVSHICQSLRTSNSCITEHVAHVTCGVTMVYFWTVSENSENNLKTYFAFPWSE